MNSASSILTSGAVLFKSILFLLSLICASTGDLCLYKWFGIGILASYQCEKSGSFGENSLEAEVVGTKGLEGVYFSGVP